MLTSLSRGVFQFIKSFYLTDVFSALTSSWCANEIYYCKEGNEASTNAVFVRFKLNLKKTSNP